MARISDHLLRELADIEDQVYAELIRECDHWQRRASRRTRHPRKEHSRLDGRELCADVDQVQGVEMSVIPKSPRMQMFSLPHWPTPPLDSTCCRSTQPPNTPARASVTDGETSHPVDAEQLTAWFAGSSDGIAVDLGRSGLVVIDVDHPEQVPEWLRETLDSAAAPYQSSRPEQSQRGHHVFTQPDGRRIGNGRGQLERYGPGRSRGRWRNRAGTDRSIARVAATSGCASAKSPSPNGIADKLTDTDEHDSAATEAEVSAFVDE